MKVTFIIGVINNIKYYIKNPFKVTLFYLGVLNGVNAKFKKFGNLHLNKKDKNDHLLDALLLSSSKSYDEEQLQKVKNIIKKKDELVVEIDGINFKHKEWVIMFELFIEREYSLLKKGNGKFIIDIGANKGYSSLYFANNGYNVIGFEPVGDVYNMGIENINLNPKLKKRIKLINKAVSCKKGKTKIFTSNLIGSSGYSQYSHYFRDKKSEFEFVDTITIKDILSEYDFIPYGIKIDCEGCEVEILLNFDLSMFKIIYFEHHEGFTKINHKILINKLKNQGFEIIGNDEFCDAIDVIAMSRE